MNTIFDTIMIEMETEGELPPIIGEVKVEGNSSYPTAGPPSSSKATECPLPDRLPAKGKCVKQTKIIPPYPSYKLYPPSMKTDKSCPKGIWYRPRFGDSLWLIARLTLKRWGLDKEIGTKEYMKQISAHHRNHIFLGKVRKHLATRQYLPRWGGKYMREEIGPGGSYGLMFLPPPNILDKREFLNIRYGKIGCPRKNS